jgi:hypothetical protein
VVVVVGGIVVVVVVATVVVVSGAARLSMSCENPKAACLPAAAPMSGGSVAPASTSAVGAEVGTVVSPRSELGEKAANAAIAKRAITTQVANASNRVNLTPVNFRVLNKRPTMRQHAWNRMEARPVSVAKPHREKHFTGQPPIPKPKVPGKSSCETSRRQRHRCCRSRQQAIGSEQGRCWFAAVGCGLCAVRRGLVAGDW